MFSFDIKLPRKLNKPITYGLRKVLLGGKRSDFICRLFTLSSFQLFLLLAVEMMLMDMLLDNQRSCCKKPTQPGPAAPCLISLIVDAITLKVGRWSAVVLAPVLHASTSPPTDGCSRTLYWKKGGGTLPGSLLMACYWWEVLAVGRPPNFSMRMELPANTTT